MFKFIKSVLKDMWRGRDDERRHETRVNEAARMLEMDEPMSAAGAQLSAVTNKSETEEALDRATGKKG